MEITLRERLYALIKHYNMTAASFERLCGFSNGFVKTAGESVGASKLAIILSLFPEISPLWLVSGLGDMLINSEISTAQNQNFVNNNKSFNNFSNSSSSEISILRQELKIKNEQIDRMIKLLEYIVYQGGNVDFPAIKTSPESRQK